MDNIKAIRRFEYQKFVGGYLGELVIVLMVVAVLLLDVLAFCRM